ncbi:MAG: hypothetical protein F4047_06050 [Caldilineaceae bacterium SB0670_bin_27]|uniref:Uncharacterized protein n=1 Tax=Caldilineaceae bacterium SB0664_bin_27 TaxID=2605260 RepID=A0A6B0YTC9_9CHLR|nr:hypothetical protein [Caldilineaceae bacterium SB0664_bin_27]MYJ77709.1 hypothetical protein [Caldilineaceae bacterium SB0670_bin_27]
MNIVHQAPIDPAVARELAKFCATNVSILDFTDEPVFVLGRVSSGWPTFLDPSNDVYPVY